MHFIDKVLTYFHPRELIKEAYYIKNNYQKAIPLILFFKPVSVNLHKLSNKKIKMNIMISLKFLARDQDTNELLINDMKNKLNHHYSFFEEMENKKINRVSYFRPENNERPMIFNSYELFLLKIQKYFKLS